VFNWTSAEQVSKKSSVLSVEFRILSQCPQAGDALAAAAFA
jgi:hypothetical protein